MPRNKSLRYVCINTILLFSFLALAGHISINFWERFTVQNQLLIMKRNLSSLKSKFQETVAQIENTYDNLDVEITELSSKIGAKLSKTLLEYDYCNKEMQEAAQRSILNSGINKHPKNTVKVTRFPIQPSKSSGINTDKTNNDPNTIVSNQKKVINKLRGKM